MTTRGRDAWVVFAVALGARLAVVAWARGRFPAAEDGTYYEALARRLASGAGYTWLWPDGTVTYAAHYPVGYPALLAVGYAVFGPSDVVAMSLAAIVGAASAYASYRIVDLPEGPRWRPLAAGLAVALHPALVPYTAARMTEGLTAALLVIAAAAASRARQGGRVWVFATAGIMAAATLVRPQSIALAPVFGALTASGGAAFRSRVARAVATTVLALVFLAPWTARNCVKMKRCALVSVNGGWNLLIGATTLNGGWQPLSVPPACAAVWDEAEKDSCFGQAAWHEFARNPEAWLSRAPAKVAMTLDYFGAAPAYLRASNPAAFGARAQTALAAVETVVSRLFLLGALFASGWLNGQRTWARRVIALVGMAAAATLHASIGYVALAACIGLLGRRALARLPVVVPVSAAVIAATVVVHVLFFGSGRYGLVVAPFVAGLCFIGAAPGDRPARPGLRARSVGCILSPSTPFGRSSDELSRHREESPSFAEHDAG